MIGFYNYTVILTYLGLASSVFGIGLAMQGRTIAALLCLLFSGFCDLFDGKVARMKKDRTDEEKQFGIQIDSLCDVICFGINPAVIGYSIGATAWWQTAILIAFVLCGVIRLAYFNVMEESRQRKTNEKLHSYKGLPITCSALIVPLAMCFNKLAGAAMPTIYCVVLAITGACYIIPFSVVKPGKRGTVIMLILGVIFTAVLLWLR